MKQRLSLLLIWFAVIWSVLIIRGLQIQIYPSNNLEQASQKQYQRVVRLHSKRGDIFDRHGEELAISVPSYSLFADPALIAKPRILSIKLAKVLGQPQKAIFKKLSKKNSRFVWVSRLMDDADHKKIASWNEKGLGFKEEFKRVYPNKSLFSHAIGFVGSDGRGLEGIEARYDSFLHADETAFNLPKDARGRFLVKDGWLFMQNRDGDDVYLTIDSDLQYFVEQELKRTIDYHKAEAAWAVVMDPRTSEILAMSSMPDFDLNKAGDAPEFARRNRVLTDFYEPGSTLKTFSILSAMQNNIVQPNTVIDTSRGKIEIDGRVIRESDADHTHERLTVAEILSYSSNVGISKMALKMKSDQIYETFKDFGFGEKSGLDLNGESRGMFAKPPWRDHHKANIAFGHGIGVTALQVANAYAAVANGGVLHKPYIVSRKRGISGPVHVNQATELRRVMSEKEAATLKMMLVAATGEKATGARARVKGFPVAGKTGTAQKVDPKGRGYLKGQYISSFVGFLPANDPEFLIYVVIDNPREKGYYATETAAPVFSRIAQYAINKRGVAPVTIAEADLVKHEVEAKEVVSAGVEESDLIPNMQGWTIRETIRYLKSKDVNVKMVGQKGRVSKTMPAAGEAWPEDKKIRVVIEQ